MATTTAIANRMTANLNPQQQRGYKTIANLLKGEKGRLMEMVPKEIDADRLWNTFYFALTKTPKLNDCAVESLIACFIICSKMGWEPNTPNQQAHMIPFFNGKTQQLECQLIPGFQGYVDLYYRTGRVKAVHAYNIYDDDEYDVEYGDNPHIKHRPNLKGKMGSDTIIASYCSVQLVSGGTVSALIPRAEMEQIKKKIKEKNKGKGGVWDDDVYVAEMMKKTAIRRVRKHLPQCPAVARAHALDVASEMGVSTLDVFNDVIDGEAVEIEEAQIAKNKSAELAAAIEAGKPEADKPKAAPRPARTPQQDNPMLGGAGISGADIDEEIDLDGDGGAPFPDEAAPAPPPPPAQENPGKEELRARDNLIREIGSVKGEIGEQRYKKELADLGISNLGQCDSAALQLLLDSMKAGKQ